MKLSLFQEYLKKQRLDLTFFAHPDAMITYFTQLVPSHAYLIITPHKATFYLTKLDQKPRIKGIKVKFLQKGWEKKITSKKKYKIGVNKEALTLHYQDKLKQLFPHAKLIDVSASLQELRAQKTPKEVKKIAQACSITSNALKKLIKELPSHKLKTEQDVALFLEREFRQQGGEVAFPTIVATGKNASVPHHVASNQKLKKGFLLIDSGAKYHNYCSDMTRILYLGKPSPQEEERYQLLLNAQELTIKSIKEGLSFKDLDKIARKNLGSYSSYFIHSLGHGVGIEVHEAPFFFSDKKSFVHLGHVFTIEPGIYLTQKWGLRIEDTLYFDGKVRVLTSASKKLVTVPFK